MDDQHDGANAWGRIDPDGTVWVRDTDGERIIGSWQAGSAEEGLAHYARRYDDLSTEIDLVEQRLASGAADPDRTAATIRRLRTSLSTAAVIGDLAATAVRLDALAARAAERGGIAALERAHRAEAALAAKRSLAEEAEVLAAEGTQWRAAGDRLRAIMAEYKQIHGVSKSADCQQWRRVIAARDHFHRRRGTHFAHLDAERKQAQGEKERLVEVVEALATSTDWGPTASRMKSAMAEWKTAGRASREVESRLWVRFRAAQDAFFHARSATIAARDKETDALRAQHRALVVDAEELDLTDPAAAQRALTSIQERYDGLPELPRSATAPLEARLQAVQSKVRTALDDRREAESMASNPLLDQMRDQVERAERRLRRAEEDGNAARITEARQALEAGRQFLRHAGPGH